MGPWSKPIKSITKAITATYCPDNASAGELAEVTRIDDLVTLLANLRADSIDNKVEAVVLKRQGGNELTYVQVNGGVALGWVASPLLSFHTLGEINATGYMGFRYLGLDAEVPKSYIISPEVAMNAATAFIKTGVPGVRHLTWEQDPAWTTFFRQEQPGGGLS